MLTFVVYDVVFLLVCFCVSCCCDQIVQCLFFTRVRQGALVIKRDEVRQRFHDALELKTGIDRRRERLDAALRDALTPDELSDFRCSVDSMCRLRLDSQWVDDRIDISQIELNALMDNILSFSQATEC